ncbi:unnamed protein product [Ixodes persulcatus]
MEVESHPEKDCSALGGLFQYIINDLKGGTPVWEDFLAKATKLHSQLRMTASVSAAFLDSFQKVADMATNTKGATKEVGKALTRLCLRQRSVEAKLKSFTSSIMDHLVLPLQDKMEDWKKMSLQLDKDHSKEFKRARQEIKKMSTDTLRLQKKVKKGARYETQRSLDCALQDVSDKYLLLEETEKQAVRRALVEERGRFCLLVACLRPVVQEELLMLHEIAHLQEILDSLARLTADPQRLPSASEQVIADLKGSDWAFQTPPSSPSSLGSRKSSMCSISSFNSSSSGSTKSHSPSHRSLSQQPAVGPPLRLSSVSSQDSGFTSQDTLFLRPPSPRSAADISTQVCDPGVLGTACVSSTPASPFPPSVTSTWPNLQDTLQFERAMSSVLKCQRPHTISSAYERAGHQARPLLTAETFQPLEGDLQSGSNHSGSADTLTSTSEGDEAPPTRGPRPPVPLRTTSAVPSLPERPAALKPVQPPRVPTLPEFHEPLACQVLPIYANVGDVMAPPGWPNSGPASEDSRTRNVEAGNAARVEDADVLRMHEAYKTYSPSSASTRYEGLSGSSTLPAKSGIRRSSQLPPPPPPIRRTPSISSNQGPSVASPQHPRIAPDRADHNGGDRTTDDASSRAKLIQALNARFSKPLEQAGLRFSLPACRPEEGPDLLLPDPPAADTAEGEPPDFPDPPPLPEQPSGQPGRQAEKKLLRAHTIGYSERDALIQSLNAKLSMRAAGQAGVAGRWLQEGAQRGPRGTTDLEQTLLKKEQRAGPEPAEARRSRSVGPCAEKRGTASVERRQFLNTLNARLAEQRSGGGASSQSPRRGSLQTELGNRRKSTDADRASRVQSWLAGRGSVDLTACRESLLDQIRRGTALKRVASQSDRSMPRLL